MAGGLVSCWAAAGPDAIVTDAMITNMPSRVQRDRNNMPSHLSEGAAAVKRGKIKGVLAHALAYRGASAIIGAGRDGAGA